MYWGRVFWGAGAAEGELSAQDPEFSREVFSMRNLKMLLMLFLAVITFGAVFSQAAEAKNAEDVFAVSERESDWVLKSGG